MEREKYFKNLRADNIEQFYRNNFSLWFIHNSEYTKFNDEPIGGMKKEVCAITNLLGLRTDNITASKNDVSGFEIKEPEFIEYEKDEIVFLLNNNTNSQLKRKLKHYLEFIQAKESQFKTSQPHQSKEELNEAFVFENNFDNIDPKEVYEHFKAGLVDENYINEETLKEFLNRAFNDYESDNPPPAKKLRMKNVSNDLGI